MIMIKNPLGNRRRQYGMSLVELMVAVTVGLALTAVLLQVFLASKQTTRMSDALSNLQSNGQFAVDVLGRAIRMAAYQGCADIDSYEANVVANNPPTNSLIDTALRGAEVAASSWSPPTPADVTSIQSTVLVNSDVIMVQHGSLDRVTQSVGMINVINNITLLTNPLGFIDNEVLMIGDCSGVEIFRTLVTNGATTVQLSHNATNNDNNAFDKAYDTTALVMRFQSDAYYIR